MIPNGAPILILLTAIAIPPLTQTQSIQLQTATDHTPQIDEAPFYALLQNAADWPPTETGATIPDFNQIAADPQNYRGQLCLIEGQLEMQMPHTPLARSGFDNVRGIVIRIPPPPTKPTSPNSLNDSDREDENSGVVIVYLTHPPALTESLYGNDVLNQRGATVRLVARFYKILTRNNRDGQPASYPLFVGHAISQLGKPAPSSAPPRFDMMFLFAILALAAWGFWRVHRLRKYVNSPNKGPLARHRQRQQNHETQYDPPIAAPFDSQDPTHILPDDPADAMNQLYDSNHHDPPTLD